MLPSVRIIYSPTQAWEAVRAARPGWTASLALQTLPFAVLAALAWPFFRTVALYLGAVAILALAFFVLSPWFGVARSWDRSMALAAYASTPVVLCGALLVFPMAAILAVPAFLHSFALCYLGAQQVLGCRESEAAMFVAMAWVLSSAASVLFGGLCSAAGLT